MNLVKFNPILEEYIAAVNPTPTQDATINSALVSILGLMLSEFSDAEGYAQGSYATDTIVKPLTAAQSSNGVAGEYDIDIVVERANWGSPVDALDFVGSVLEGDPRYNKMPIDKTKNSCVRIEYAEDSTGVRFHVDIVPTKLENGIRFVADREQGEWKSSDAKLFAERFNQEVDQTPALRSLAIILKRLRDRNGLTDNLKSILVLTLVLGCYAPQGSLMGNLSALLESIKRVLGPAGTPPPVINNPVNSDEDLMSGVKDIEDLREFFAKLNDSLVTALAQDDSELLK